MLIWEVKIGTDGGTWLCLSMLTCVMLEIESKVLGFWNVFVIRSMLLFLDYLPIGCFELLSCLGWVGVGLVCRGKSIVLSFHPLVCVGLCCCWSRHIKWWHHISLCFQQDRIGWRTREMSVQGWVQYGQLVQLQELIVCPGGKCGWKQSCIHQEGWYAVDLLFGVC